MAATTPKRTRRRAPQHAGCKADQLQRWLQRRARLQIDEHGTAVWKQRPLRTSSRTVTLWQASARTSFAAADRSDPDVAAAMRLGFDVVRRDAIGDSTRQALGDAVFVVRMHHVPGGVGGQQLGVILHIGQTFFVYLLSSARAGNLEAETDDRRANAATEVLSLVTRAMYRVGTQHDPAYRPHVFARDHDRLVRDEGHGAALKRTFVACRVIAHTPHTTDLTDPAQAQGFTFGSVIAAGAADAAIRGMNRAEIVIQAAGGYYEGIDQAPFTHGARVLVETDARTGVEVTTVDKHRLAYVEDVEAARRTLRRLVDKILEDRHQGRRAHPATDWQAVGDLMAELGLPSRLPEHRKKGITLQHLPAGSRYHAARSLFSTRWIDGWRHGRYAKLVPVKIHMDLDLDDLGAEATMTSDGRPAYQCCIHIPIPDGGWGITDQEWDEVLVRRYPPHAKEREYSGLVHPLIGHPEWQDDALGCQYELTTKNGGYLFRGRPLAQAFHPDGEPRGWADSDWTRLGTVRTRELHTDIARAMRAALLALDAAAHPVRLAPAAGARQSQPAAGAVQQAQQAEARAELEDAEDQLAGAEDHRNATAGRVRRGKASAAELARADRSVQRAQARVDQAGAALQRLEQQAQAATAPAAAEQEVQVRTATAEFVTAALAKCTTTAPVWLRDACQALLRDLRLEPVPDVAGGRPKIRWSATLVLPTLDADSDGDEVPAGVPIGGEVFNRMNAQSNNDQVLHGPEAWAWAFFYTGRSFAEIGQAAGGIDGSGKKNSYLYKGLQEWLAAAVVDQALRTAALDCPIPATRRVLWALVTGDQEALAGIDDGFIEHICATYAGAAIRPSWGWARDPHQVPRQVAALLVPRGGTVPLHELAGQLGLPPERITAWARVNGKPTGNGTARTTPAVAVSPFTKSWVRGRHWLAPEDRTISLRPCPHRDCPERLAGGTPFASHILWVPETEAAYGALCPSCRRLPSKQHAGVYFPRDYLRPWSGRFGRGSRAGARQQAGSHLDVLFPDPGPAPALPNTGAAPRAETRTHQKPGSYVPVDLQDTPLAGARVLPLGLTAAQQRRVAAAVETLGGRIGSKVTASLACVVLGEHPGTDAARAARAADLQVPVLTVAEFLAAARAGWIAASGRAAS